MVFRISIALSDLFILFKFSHFLRIWVSGVDFGVEALFLISCGFVQEL